MDIKGKVVEAMTMTIEEAKRLLKLSDKELARVGNRYKYDPRVLVIQGGKARMEKAEEWAKMWLNGWSDPASSTAFLKEECGILEVIEQDIARSWMSDGDCRIVLVRLNREGKSEKYTYESNGYIFECYVKAIRWALKRLIEDND